MEDIILYNNFNIENAVEEEDSLKIEGYCAHFNKANLNNEIVTETSFNEFFSLYNSGKHKPALNYNHTDQIIGGIDGITKNSEGLFMTAHINKNVPICEMIIPNVLKGDITGLSTEGYIVGGVDGVDFLDDDTYVVKNFLLTAVAVTPTPADWAAQFCVKNYLEHNKISKPEPQKRISVLLLL